MAQKNLRVPSTTGAAAAALEAADAAGDSFPLPRPIMIRVANGSGAGRTLTVVAQRPCNQGVTHNGTVAVGVGETVEFAVTDLSRFADANGRVQITYDAAAGVTIGAYTI